VFSSSPTAARPRAHEPGQLINNDFASITIGLVLTNSSTNTVAGIVASNIFWETTNQSNARNGYAIFSTIRINPRFGNNLFFATGLVRPPRRMQPTTWATVQPALAGPLAQMPRVTWATSRVAQPLRSRLTQIRARMSANFFHQC